MPLADLACKKHNEGRVSITGRYFIVFLSLARFKRVTTLKREQNLGTRAVDYEAAAVQPPPLTTTPILRIKHRSCAGMRWARGRLRTLSHLHHDVCGGGVGGGVGGVAITPGRNRVSVINQMQASFFQFFCFVFTPPMGQVVILFKHRFCIRSTPHAVTAPLHCSARFARDSAPMALYFGE